MSDIISKKQRNIHNRDRKIVVLVITSDKNTRKSDLYVLLQLSREKYNVVLLQTELTGINLKSAIKRYIRDNEIHLSRGDRVVFLDDRM